jgi:hypothetical protein
VTKKLYIYEAVDGLTESWHDGGAMVIITAGDPQEALDAARTEFYAPDYKPHLTELPEPSRVLDVGESEADAIFEFPDAGCC